jgi:glycosyltransferase Alg8
MSWPVLLYANQIVNAGVKAYMQFFLHRQTWANRGGQRAGDGSGAGDRVRNAFATYQFVTAVSVFVYIVGLMGGMFPAPGFF